MLLPWPHSHPPKRNLWPNSYQLWTALSKQQIPMWYMNTLHITIMPLISITLKQEAWSIYIPSDFSCYKCLFAPYEKDKDMNDKSVLIGFKDCKSERETISFDTDKKPVLTICCSVPLQVICIYLHTLFPGLQVTGFSCIQVHTGRACLSPFGACF